MRVYNGFIATLAVAVLSAGAANAQFNAYDVATPSVGNHTFGGSFGLNFDVVTPINVTRLGFYDSGQNGILGVNQILTTAIFNRNAPAVPLAVLTFSTALPGTLDGSYRFKDLGVALALPVGQYQVTSWGYSASNRAGNLNFAGFLAPSTNTGAGIVTYGNSLFSLLPGTFATTDDAAPDPHYGAGNFTFVRANAPPPPPQGGAPEPGTFALLTVGAVALVGFARRKRN